MAALLGSATVATANDYRIRPGDTVTVYMDGQSSLDRAKTIYQQRIAAEGMASGSRTRFQVEESFVLLPGDPLIVNAAMVGS